MSSTSSTTTRTSSPSVVYFSSVTENTKHLVDKLSVESHRIPLKRMDPPLYVEDPYILMVPSYGGGEDRSAVPKQVIKFLNVESNRNLCIGIIAAGNMNFGKHYCIAGKIISSKLQVPVFYQFELRGMPGDSERIEEGIREVFKKYAKGEILTVLEISRLRDLTIAK